MREEIKTLRQQYADHAKEIEGVNENITALQKTLDDIKEGKVSIPNQTQVRRQSMPIMSSARRILYPECEENEKDRHDSALILQLRIDGTVARPDANVTVAGILASAGIDASAAIAKSFKVDPLPPRNGQTRINLRFEDQDSRDALRWQLVDHDDYMQDSEYKSSPVQVWTIPPKYVSARNTKLFKKE